MRTITQNQLKTELSFWLHPDWLRNSKNLEQDINKIVSSFYRYGQRRLSVAEPIGDFTLKALRENRAPEKYSTNDARFEILAFLVPILDGISIHTLKNRFSREVFNNSVLTQTERANLKTMVWQRMNQSEKDILRARVLTDQADQALMIATTQEFLNARRHFWELLADALQFTHATALTALLEGNPQNNDVNVQHIVDQLFNANKKKEIFSRIYPTPTYGYCESMSTYIQLKIELLYWVRHRRDVDSIAHDLCFCHTGEKIQHIGDYVYNCLTHRRLYKAPNQYKNAKFETLPILIPQLADTPLTDDMHNRFSREVFTSVLTNTERENLKIMVWQRLTQNQRMLLLKRIQSTDGSHIASHPDFLDIARDPFWKLTARALHETYKDTLTEQKYDEEVVSNFFMDTEKFATAYTMARPNDGSYTGKGYLNWISKSIRYESRGITPPIDDADGLDGFDQIQLDRQNSEGRGHLSGLIRDEFKNVMRQALGTMVQFLIQDYGKVSPEKFLSTWQIAPQLVFLLIGCILAETTPEFNLRTGKRHSEARSKDLNALKQRAVKYLKKPHQDLKDDQGKIIYDDIYELLYRGTKEKQLANDAVRNWQNQILDLIKIELLKSEHMPILQELLTPNGRDELITETEVRETIKSTKMIQDMWPLIRDVWSSTLN